MRTRTAVLVLGLVALAALQTTMLVARRATENPPPPQPLTDLSQVMATDAEGRRQPLADGWPALVLVFDPECPHTQRVAPVWRDWLDTADSSIRVVALSASAQAVAAAYAAEAGWSVPVLAIRAEEPGSPERQVARRTPWVFAVDERGQVVADGPGGRVSEIADALRVTVRPGGPTSFRTLDSLRTFDTRRNHA